MILDCLENFHSDIFSLLGNGFVKCTEFLRSIKEGFVKENESKSIIQPSNEEIFIKEYKDNYCFNKNDKIDSKVRLTLQNSLNKFEEFKNSLKNAYNLESYNLLVDNKIDNFKDNRKKNIEDYEKFYIEVSLDMYKEIFKPNINN